MVESRGRGFETDAELAAALDRPGSLIAYGMGRSYGDSALADRFVSCRRFDKFLSFEPDSGRLHCESGVTLAEILDVFLPRGWFLSVTPGTRFITVGGAVASDVHGKNHHGAGCFSRWVEAFTLMLADGSTRRCSRTRNVELFRATCGGMGLTGVILDVVLVLRRIQSAFIRETVVKCRNLSEVFDAFEHSADVSYSVAWIDCLAKGADIGRSVLMLGEHAASGRRDPPRGPSLTLPAPLPCGFLNRLSVSFFNRCYYRSHPDATAGRLTPLDRFFYPLDRIGRWNLMYGRRGFTQYQFVLPKAASGDGLNAVLGRIARAGLGSFLGVLKLFGAENDNLLSFPLEGYTLALDFKIENRLFPFLDDLDRVVVDHGGRIYLTKDVRMSAAVFRAGYPRWERFAALRRRLGLDRKFGSLQSKRVRI